MKIAKYKSDEFINLENIELAEKPNGYSSRVYYRSELFYISHSLTMTIVELRNSNGKVFLKGQFDISSDEQCLAIFSRLAPDIFLTAIKKRLEIAFDDGKREGIEENQKQLRDALGIYDY